MPVTKEERTKAAKAGMASTQPPPKEEKPDEELTAAEGYKKYNTVRFVGKDASGNQLIHPDDMDFPGSLEHLQKNYAPTLEEFEAKFGPLPTESMTRSTYVTGPMRRHPTTGKIHPSDYMRANPNTPIPDLLKWYGGYENAVRLFGPFAPNDPIRLYAEQQKQAPAKAQ